jgi:hypothetical protein
VSGSSEDNGESTVNEEIDDETFEPHCNSARHKANLSPSQLLPYRVSSRELLTSYYGNSALRAVSLMGRLPTVELIITSRTDLNVLRGK